MNASKIRQCLPKIKAFAAGTPNSAHWRRCRVRPAAMLKTQETRNVSSTSMRGSGKGSFRHWAREQALSSEKIARGRFQFGGTLILIAIAGLIFLRLRPVDLVEVCHSYPSFHHCKSHDKNQSLEQLSSEIVAPTSTLRIAPPEIKLASARIEDDYESQYLKGSRRNRPPPVS